MNPTVPRADIPAPAELADHDLVVVGSMKWGNFDAFEVPRDRPLLEPRIVMSFAQWRRRNLKAQAFPVREVEALSNHVAGSRRLTEWAARILPAADQGEYEELFNSELFDLARSGGGRRAQLTHALRVLVRAPLLRRELRAPARERSR